MHLRRRRKKKRKNAERVKATDEGLEGFVDWTDLTVSESAKEREAEMFSLTTGFAMRMRKQFSTLICKRSANAHGEATLGSKGLDGKRSRWYGSKKEAQMSPAIIAMDFPERAPDGVLDLEGSAQGALKEAFTTLED